MNEPCVHLWRECRTGCCREKKNVRAEPGHLYTVGSVGRSVICCPVRTLFGVMLHAFTRLGPLREMQMRNVIRGDPLNRVTSALVSGRFPLPQAPCGQSSATPHRIISSPAPKETHLDASLIPVWASPANIHVPKSLHPHPHTRFLLIHPVIRTYTCRFALNPSFLVSRRSFLAFSHSSSHRYPTV